MSAIQMSLGYVSPTVELPCAFIDRYMTHCAPVYALIYIHSLRQCIGGASVISSQEIAQLFHILETDVHNAWRYWENAGLIRFEQDGDAISVTFLPVPTAATPYATANAPSFPSPLSMTTAVNAVNAVNADTDVNNPVGDDVDNDVDNNADSGVGKNADKDLVKNIAKSVIINTGNDTANNADTNTDTNTGTKADINTDSKKNVDSNEAEAEGKGKVEAEAEVKVEAEAGAETKSAPKEVVRTFVTSHRPQYTVQELAVYRSQSRDIERLFAHAEQTLGKMLTYHDMNVLFGFYDWLRLPIDVIQYLLTYCAENDHQDLRYIEKAALDWADNQIDDLEKAFDYIQTFDRGKREILRALGQTSGIPSPTQRKHIKKWLLEYNLTVDMVLDACDRASEHIGRAKLTYVNTILEKWHAKGVRTDEDIAAEDAAFAQQKAEKAERAEKAEKAEQTGKAKSERSKSETKQLPPKGNRFINFKQRERDYAELEKMEREYLVQSLKG